jgi:intracellular septation protein
MLVKLIEFLPVIAFFGTYKFSSDLIVSTAVVVTACVIATALEYLITKKISRMQVFLLAAVLLFGIPTVLLRDPSIIKWKVTVVNLIFAAAIFIFQFLLRKNPFGYLFGQEIPLPADAWKTMSAGFMVFFVFAAALNVVIAFFLPQLFGISEETAESLWVDYKSFGNGILNAVFAIILMVYIFRKNPQALEDAVKNRQVKKKPD